MEIDGIIVDVLIRRIKQQDQYNERINSEVRYYMV